MFGLFHKTPVLVNDDCDSYDESCKEWTFETYPFEGDQDTLAFCRQFAEEWNGRTALGLVSPHCRRPWEDQVDAGRLQSALAAYTSRSAPCRLRELGGDVDQ